MKPNTQQLFAATSSLTSHVQALDRATNNQPQSAVDKLTAAVLDADNKVVAVLTAPPIPGPTGKLDFSGFDKAAAAFKADGRHSQDDVDKITNVLVVNQ